MNFDKKNFWSEVGRQEVITIFIYTDFGPRTSDFRLRTSVFGLRTSDLGPRTSDFGLRTSDFGLRTPVFKYYKIIETNVSAIKLQGFNP